MVLHEGEHAVLARVIGLEPLGPVPVGFEDVDVVLAGMADGDVPQDEAVGAVRADADVLVVPDGPVISGGDATRVHDHGIRTWSGALQLHVAANARPEVRDPVPVDARLLGIAAPAGPPANDRHQVLGVGAVVLVRVGQCGRLTPVVQDLVLLARRVEVRLGARRRFGVDARHDHDAVVVAGTSGRRLDLVVPAAREQQLVEALEAPTAAPRQGPGLVAGAELEAPGPRLLDRAAEPPYRHIAANAPPVLAHGGLQLAAQPLDAPARRVRAARGPEPAPQLANPPRA